MSRVPIHDHTNIHQGGKLRAANIVTGAIADGGSDSGGTGGTGPPGPPGTDANLPWFNIVDYGAVIDGTTDDTTAVQDTIDAATAAGGGVIYHPGGPCLIAGALRDTGAFNGQILLPTVSTSSPQITLVFLGPLRPPIAYHGTAISAAYATYKSTLTGASGTASVFSGGNSGQNNIQVVVENILCTAPDNPTFTFWNLGTTQGGEWDGLMISTVGIISSASVTQPSHSNAYGIKLPQTNNSNLLVVGSITVYGFYTGILHGELAEARYIVSLCIVGVEVPFMNHPGAHINLQPTATPYGIRFTGGANYVDIWYDAEHANVSAGGPYNPAWSVIVDDIDDPSNYWHGHARWQAIVAGTGAIDTFTVNGGSNGLWEQIGAAPTAVASFGTPAVVLGTAAAAGAATTAVRTDATIVAFDATVPVTQAFGDAAATGSSAHAARRDHVHGMPATPSSGSGSDHEHIQNVVFSGDASTTVWELPAAPVDSTGVAVYVTGARSLDWTLSGTLLTTLTFGSAPASAANNIVIDIEAAVA